MVIKAVLPERNPILQNRKLLRKEAMEGLTRKDILDSAILVLLDKGIRRFTMDQVASNAGIAKGTIYLYFKEKHQLLDSVVDHCYEPLAKEFENIAGAICDPVSKLEQIVFESMKFTENNKKIFNEVRNIMFNTLDQAIGDGKSWYWNTVHLFAAVLDEAVKAGKFRPMNTVKVAALFFDSINTFMSHRILSDVKETIEEDTREIMSLYIKGLST
jgi:AcrR family transcriptional regulator